MPPVVFASSPLDACICTQVPVCSECMLCVHKAPDHLCDRIVDIEAAQLDELKALVVDSQAKVEACEELSSNLEDMLTTLQEQKDTAHARILEAFKTYAALLEKRKVCCGEFVRFHTYDSDTGKCRQCFDAVGWVTEKASGL